MTGENGILNKALKAKAETIVSNAREEIEMAWNSSVMDYYEAISSGDDVEKSEFFSSEKLNNLIQSGKIESVEYSEEEDSIVTFVDNSQNVKYRFIVSNSGKVFLEDNEDKDNGEDKIVEDVEPVRELKVGDYVEYVPDSALAYTCNKQYSGVESNESITQSEVEKWRIFSINNKRITLISEAPTKTKITLSSYNGYNNGVWLLNDICESLWSASGVGLARSITVEDVDSVSKYDISKFTNGINTYGDKAIYTDENYNKYPKLYAYEKDNLEISESLLNEDGSLNFLDGYESDENGLEVKQTYYIYSSANVINETLRNMIFQKQSYWTASRYVDAYKDFASFGMHVVDNVSMNGCIMFFDLNNTLTSSYAIRPIVELSSKVKVDTQNGDGTIDSPYQLIY